MGRVVAYVVTIFLSMALFGVAADIGVTIATGQSSPIAGGLGGLAGLVLAIVGLNLYFSAKQSTGEAAGPASSLNTHTDATGTTASRQPSTAGRNEQARPGATATRLDDILAEPPGGSTGSSRPADEGVNAENPARSVVDQPTSRETAHADLWAMIDERTGPK